jgi:ABC-type transport system involved in Fe-S cluster assembly fused permease/ATPase subunit
MKGRTTIIIAHRLSTIMKADKIIVLKKGKIVQAGTHAQLIKKPGEYKKLWNLQKGGYIR